MPSRRRFLAALGAGALGVFAGCSASADEPPAPGTPDLDPERQIYGSDGNWSSFGCNAGNTRSVHGIHAGEAPVDGVDEEWRVPVTDLQRTAPVVAGSRVYLPTRGGLRVYDAEDGTELWREDGIEDSPVVRGETVFAADSAENAVRALAADSGDERWSAETDVPRSDRRCTPERRSSSGGRASVRSRPGDGRRGVVAATVRNRPPQPAGVERLRRRRGDRSG
ncbi:PQQ-binding-like beta-propeller repeat protein [Haloarcula sp. JP-L23]|uniref:outer membrane protein assembly factor BamB family protein n=1 Tax=Haloarcula sp. JP-L23 TaxID=2716717 RepID=UPI0032E5261A